MNIKNKLIELVTYYEVTRQTGHTTLLKEGITHYNRPFFVLSHCAVHGMELGISPKDTISYQNLQKLRGHRRPLAIDNAVMCEILSDALMRIEALEEENKDLRIQKQAILTTPGNKLVIRIEELEKELENLRNQK